MEKCNKPNSEEKRNGAKNSTKELKDSGDVVSTRRKKSRDEKVIRLLGNRSVYHVLVEDFIKVSQLIKQQNTASSVMSSVDLSKFSDQSILAFVNYIQTREVKSSLTYYAITELLTLSKSFQMRELKMCLEDAIVEASKLSEADLLQTLLICDVAQMSPETERILQLSAIEAIDKIVALPDFHKIPFYQIYQILSACELAATHEMFVADVAIFWLTGQTHLNAYAPAMFSCIRTKFLSPVDKTMILERIHLLNMPEKLIRLARNILESSNSQRACAEPSHAKKNARCNPNPTTQPAGVHTSLPLSRPSFTIKMKKSKETNTKSRPRFDPKSAPKVIDLIQKDPKKAVSPVSKKSKSVKGKSKCACVEYFKSKFGEKKMKRSKCATVLPPKSAADKSAKSEKTTKGAASRSDTSARSSRMSKSGKTTSSASDKKTEKRHDIKRKRIDDAMKGAKSKSTSEVSGSQRSSRSSSNKTKNSSKPRF